MVARATFQKVALPTVGNTTFRELKVGCVCPALLTSEPIREISTTQPTFVLFSLSVSQRLLGPRVCRKCPTNWAISFHFFLPQLPSRPVAFVISAWNCLFSRRVVVAFLVQTVWNQFYHMCGCRRRRRWILFCCFMSNTARILDSTQRRPPLVEVPLASRMPDCHKSQTEKNSKSTSTYWNAIEFFLVTAQSAATRTGSWLLRLNLHRDVVHSGNKRQGNLHHANAPIQAQ